MTEIFGKDKIIKIDNVDRKYVKKLGEDKLFKFECENINEQLRIGLIEINAYSPYYYEAFFSKDDLDEKNDVFRAKRTIDEIIVSLLKLFEKRGSLGNTEGDNIIVSFQIPSFEEYEEIKFELEKKTVEDKDAALLDLFDIQKDNIKILNKIREECRKKPNDPVFQKILECLNNKN